ncbi:hypothetical protein PQR36_37655 [Paraburkholderia nemoris]
MKRYLQLAAEFESLILNGTLKPDVRLPSVRQASCSYRVSPSTVIFSCGREFGRHIRLNYGRPWTPDVEKEMHTLGMLARHPGADSCALANAAICCVRCWSLAF